MQAAGWVSAAGWGQKVWDAHLRKTGHGAVGRAWTSSPQAAVMEHQKPSRNPGETRQRPGRDWAETRKRPGCSWTTDTDSSRLWRLHVQDEGASRVSAVRTCFLVRRRHLLTVSSPGGRGERAPWGLLHKDPDSTLTSTPSSWPHHLPEEPLLTPSCRGLGFNIWVWEWLRQSVAEKY